MNNDYVYLMGALVAAGIMWSWWPMLIVCIFMFLVESIYWFNK